MTDYQNRIIGFEYVNSRDLTPHPGNPGPQIDKAEGPDIDVELGQLWPLSEVRLRDSAVVVRVKVWLPKGNNP